MKSVTLIANVFTQVLPRLAIATFTGVHSAFAKAGLDMNLTKTEVLVQRASGFFELAASQIFVEDTDLSLTDKFTYHGFIITCNVFSMNRCYIALQYRLLRLEL